MTSPVSPSETIAKAMEGVTAEEWIVNGDRFSVETNATYIPDQKVIALCATGEGAMARSLYIAACNPVAIREVLDELYALRAFAEEAKADIAKYRRMAVDRAYMLNSYRNMLGPKGLEVAAMWERKGVTRQHTDWGPEAGKMTGEERAQALLDVEAHIPQPLDFADSARTLIQGEKK